MFEGSDGSADSLVKFNPLSDVSSAEVWNFLRVMVRPVLQLSGCICLLELVRLSSHC